MVLIYKGQKRIRKSDENFDYRLISAAKIMQENQSHNTLIINI